MALRQLWSAAKDIFLSAVDRRKMISSGFVAVVQAGTEGNLKPARVTFRRAERVAFGRYRVVEYSLPCVLRRDSRTGMTIFSNRLDDQWKPAAWSADTSRYGNFHFGYSDACRFVREFREAHAGLLEYKPEQYRLVVPGAKVSIPGKRRVKQKFLAFDAVTFGLF
jgi:hypothetical protein